MKGEEGYVGYSPSSFLDRHAFYFATGFPKRPFLSLEFTPVNKATNSTLPCLWAQTPFPSGMMRGENKASTQSESQTDKVKLH